MLCAECASPPVCSITIPKSPIFVELWGSPLPPNLCTMPCTNSSLQGRLTESQKAKLGDGKITPPAEVFPLFSWPEICLFVKLDPNRVGGLGGVSSPLELVYRTQFGDSSSESWLVVLVEPLRFGYTALRVSNAPPCHD